MDTSMNDLVKETARQQLTEASERLKNLCRLDANRPADQRVADLTPEFRAVIQEALDDMYRIVDEPEY